MAIFSERHPGYRGGVVLLFIGLVAYIVGFASPYWTTATLQGSSPSVAVHVHNGLWQSCAEAADASYCVSLPVSRESESEAWDKFIAVQVLQCIALVGFLPAVCYAIYVNCRSDPRILRRFLETVSAGCSVIALIGIIIYGTLMDASQIHIIVPTTGDTVDIKPLAWAFIVDTIGCSLTFIAAIIIAVFNRSLGSEGRLLENATG